MKPAVFVAIVAFAMTTSTFAGSVARQTPTAQGSVLVAKQKPWNAQKFFANLFKPKKPLNKYQKKVPSPLMNLLNNQPLLSKNDKGR